MSSPALTAAIGFGLAAAVSVASCGSSRPLPPGASTSPARAHSSLSVAPSVGSPTTSFALRFTAPATSERGGAYRLGYEIGLTAPSATRCIGSRSILLPAVTKGVPVRILLAPARLGGAWCLGTYAARAVETETPVCPAGTVCPQFVRVIGTVGRATFRIAP